MRMTASYDKQGILTLADDKPVVYRIQDARGKDNYVGSVRVGRLVDRISEHLGEIPGAMVRIQQHESIQSAKVAEQRIINRVKPRFNRK